MSHRRRADHYSRRAREEGYGARSVYKLEEIERRCRVIPRAGRVLDLGCAPGSWSRFVRQKAGGRTTIVGIDLSAVDGYPGTFLQASIDDVEASTLAGLLGGPADLVLTDLAPKTTGARDLDHYRQVELVRRALELAVDLLRPGGAFVTKVFDGGDANDLLDEVRAHFGGVRRVRPKAVRSESREFFAVATGFKG